MKRVSKILQVALIVLAVAALSGCSLGAAASPTPTAVDVNAVMTSAAATAFVQLTDIAAQASPTSAPSQTPTQSPTATQDQALLLLTATESAGGLPIVETPVVPVATAEATAAGLPATTAIPSLTPFTAPGATSVATCYNSQFVADVTVPDGTVFKPREKFNKVWRVKNTGTCAWDEGFGLILWAGPSMDGYAIYFSSNDNPVQPGGVVDLGINMKAPFEPGDYVAHWTMIDDKGKTFGGDLTVFIKVAK